jgi:hypothetical protein
MKILVVVVSALLCTMLGIRIYDAFATPDRLTCIANADNFGCFTPFGVAISLAAVVVMAIAIYIWERFRG